MLFRKVNKLIPQKYKNYYHFIIANIALLWFSYPAKDLNVIGVTGTDGKTTTSTIIYEILKKAGKKVALVSTVAAYIGDKELDTGFHVTAPDPWMLQKLLRQIRNLGYEYVVLEATSHGLDQYRLLGTNIKTAVLTNITHEHLDYHGTYENYVKAKSKIFKEASVAIINKDDSSYQKIKKLINKKVNILSYDLNTPTKVVKEAIFKKFPEIYNRHNAIAAYLAAKNFGVSDAIFAKAILGFKGVIGRMEEIKNKKKLRIIVDFAHTPNALEEVLTALKKQKTNNQKLIAVFGCASERDDKKRPMMGEISTRVADVSIFTAEDPRREDINKILNEMENGAVKRSKYHKIPERGEAISFAINKAARTGDIVVICGKGHEKSMAYNGIEYPWSDQKAVELALKGKVLRINH